MKRGFQIFILTLFCALIVGCSEEEIEIMNYTNNTGDFIISAPVDYEYHPVAGDDMMILGSEDQNTVIMVLQFNKESVDFRNFEDFIEISRDINEDFPVKLGEEKTIYEDYLPEGAENAYLERSFLTSDGKKGVQYTACLDYPGWYYIMQVNSFDRRSPDYFEDIFNSFRVGVNPYEPDFSDQTYRHELGLYQFIYPYPWRRLDFDEEGVILYPRDYDVTVTVLSREEEITGLSLEEYMAIVKEQLHDEAGVFIIEEEYKELNGVEACTIIYNVNQENGILKTRQTCMIQKDRVFLISYYGEEKEYENFLKDVIFMEENFKITRE